jgi:hypothetical protein
MMFRGRTLQRLWGKDPHPEINDPANYSLGVIRAELYTNVLGRLGRRAMKIVSTSGGALHCVMR